MVQPSGYRLGIAASEQLVYMHVDGRVFGIVGDTKTLKNVDMSSERSFSAVSLITNEFDY